MAVEGPLRILAVLVSPVDHPPALAIEDEWTRLQSALDDAVKSGQVVLSRLSEPTWDGLREYLRTETVHVLHFVGHGLFDPTGGGSLIFADEEGNSQPISAQKLADLLHNETTLRLAVLNACEGAVTDAENPFAGVAQALAQRGLPAVIAMQRVISDRAAIQFSGAFYAALADDYPVDAALAQARLAIYGDDEVEWATPTLFLRAIDGATFARNVVQIAGRQIPYWMVGALAGALLLIIGLVGYNIRQGNQTSKENQQLSGQVATIQEKVLATHTPTPLPSATPTATPLRMPDGSFNIAVAPFAPEPGNDTINPVEAIDLSQSVANFLDDQSDTLTQVLGERVTVWGPDMGLPEATGKSAADLAAGLNADALIYGLLQEGSSGRLDVLPQFYLSDKAVRQAEELGSDYALGHRITYRPEVAASKRDVNQALAVRLRAVSSLLIGLSYMTFGDGDGYRRATETFQEVVDTSEWAKADDGTGQEVLHLFLGSGYLSQAFLTEDGTEERAALLAEAQTAFTQTIALNPTYARGYNGLGSVFFQQARAATSTDGCLAGLLDAQTAYEEALEQRPEDKPVSGQVDFRANFGLGAVFNWRGVCLDISGDVEGMVVAWKQARIYAQATVDAYWQMADPPPHSTDIVAQSYAHLGVMDVTEVYYAEPDIMSSLTIEHKEQLTHAIKSFEQAFTLALKTQTQDAQNNLRGVLPFHLIALCGDGQAEKALSTLDTYIAGDDEHDPAESQAYIIDVIPPDMWTTCVKMARD